MQIKDLTVIGNILKSKKISLSALIHFRDYTPSAGICTQEIKTRIEPIKAKFDTLTSGKNEHLTATDFQTQISELIDCELWIATNQIMPILPEATLKKLKLTQQETITEKGYLSLGQRIYDYNDRVSNADKQAELIVTGDASAQEKVFEVYELREFLNPQKIKEVLYNELASIGNKIVQEPLPEYTGKNAKETKLAIKRKLEEALGKDALSKLLAMNLDEITPEFWSGVLNVQYIEAEQKKYAQQLSEKLQSVHDYREAFDIDKSFAWRVDRTVLRQLMSKYVTEVDSVKRAQIQDVILPQDVTEAGITALTYDLLNEIISDECWIVYYLCYYLTPVTYDEAHKQMTNAVFVDAERKIKQIGCEKIETQISELEKELSSAKGLFAGKRKKELNKRGNCKIFYKEADFYQV